MGSHMPQHTNQNLEFFLFVFFEQNNDLLDIPYYNLDRNHKNINKKFHFLNHQSQRQSSFMQILSPYIFMFLNENF